MSFLKKRYRVGIDVGLYGIGLSAIEIDAAAENPLDAVPVDLLNIQTVIHDGGVDPSKLKTSDSRKATSGIARRSRKLTKAKRRRLGMVDSVLSKHGYPLVQTVELQRLALETNPYAPWEARKKLVETYIEDELERKRLIVLAVRHIARHRGWRNSYSSIASLADASKVASKFYMSFFSDYQIWLYEQGFPLADDVVVERDEKNVIHVSGVPEWDTRPDLERPTVAQIVSTSLRPMPSFAIRNTRFHKNNPEHPFVHLGKFHQSDNYYELKRIFEMQRVSEKEQALIIETVFHVTHPRETGAAAKLIARDDLNPSRSRTSRASIAFQKNRILQTLTNIEVKGESAAKRKLSSDEVETIYKFLLSNEALALGANITWEDVASVIGLTRNDFSGIGGVTEDGYPISMKTPPLMDTELVIEAARHSGSKLTIAPFLAWWQEADDLSKEFMLDALGNVGYLEGQLSEEEQSALGSVNDFLESECDEEVLGALEKLRFPTGRVAYSVPTLMRLNDLMLYGEMDSYSAKQALLAERNMPLDWKPSVDPLGTLTGNPAVDRSIRIVSRWLKACVRRWGAPEIVVIEHVREGFNSPKKQHELDRVVKRRTDANDELRAEISEKSKELCDVQLAPKSIRRSDITRWKALQRQNCKCMYCGKKIDFMTAEIDHVVPRSSIGCSNDRANLVAVCSECNMSKGKDLLSEWSAKNSGKGYLQHALSMLGEMIPDAGMDKKQFKAFKQNMKSRFLQTEKDEPFDNRSIESVAWMARQLREQIEGYLREADVAENGKSSTYKQRVFVYRGTLTAEARRASGLEKNLPWLGDRSGKNRLDRRHHAIDASVVALLRPSVAEVLSTRLELKTAQSMNPRSEIDQDWKDYEGSISKSGESRLSQRANYIRWRDVQMSILRDLLEKSMTEDRIPVCRPLRLRLAVGRAHEDTIQKFVKKKLGDAHSAIAIDKVESEELWKALTALSDYDKEKGLPSDPSRRIEINGKIMGPNEKIGFMSKGLEKLDALENFVAIPVRGGFAGVGDTIHHVRLFRFPKRSSKGQKTGWEYAQLRVFQRDLLAYRNEDLFSVELPPWSTSIRNADNKLRNALSSNEAAFLGWIVVNDEVVIDSSHPTFSPDGKMKINLFMKAFPNTTHFVVSGFGTNSKMTIKPSFFAEEGIPNLSTISDPEKRRGVIRRTYGQEDLSDDQIEKIDLIIRKGYIVEVNKLLATQPTFVRRNVLGEMRWSSDNHMPVSFKIDTSDAD